MILIVAVEKLLSFIGNNSVINQNPITEISGESSFEVKSAI